MSTHAMSVHVALVDDTGQMSANELAQFAGALNEQIQSDFAPVWGVRATVGAYPSAPPNQWAVHIQQQLDEPGALGYHTDDHNQPISYVMMTGDVSVTASHEVLEMLADPWGNRMHAAELPAGLESQYSRFGLRSAGSPVWYLLEVSDPCEATSYMVGGVALSDFLLPGWYRTQPSQKVAYSHAGGCVRPREVADGGYVSFANAHGEWYQVFNRGGNLQMQDLGRFDKTAYGSLREWADHCARKYRAGTR